MQAIVGSVFLFGNARRCDSRGTLAASGVGPKAGSDAGNLTRLNAAIDTPIDAALDTCVVCVLDYNSDARYREQRIVFHGYHQVSAAIRVTSFRQIFRRIVSEIQLHKGHIRRLGDFSPPLCHEGVVFDCGRDGQ